MHGLTSPNQALKEQSGSLKTRPSTEAVIAAPGSSAKRIALILNFTLNSNSVPKAKAAVLFALLRKATLRSMVLSSKWLIFATTLKAAASELTGGLYRALAPKQQVYKPEAWNSYQIRLLGAQIKVVLNGTLILDQDLITEETAIKRHDGKDAPALKDRPRKGRIGFQNLSRGGSPVLIRKAKIKILKP